MNHLTLLSVGRSAFILACLGLASCSSNDPAITTTSGGTPGNGGASTASGGSSATTKTGKGGTSATAAEEGGTDQGGASLGGGDSGGADQGGTSSKSVASSKGGTSSKSGSSSGSSKGGSSAQSGGGEGGAAEGGSSSVGGTSSTSGTAVPDADGKCGLAWASGGADGAPALDATVEPIADSAKDKYTFTFGRYKLVVSANKSGNVYEFSIDGKNVIETTNGSTFWPSPQHDASNAANYTWPPPTELDGGAYTASVADNILSLEGKTSSALNLSFNKRIWVNEASAVVSLEYTIINHASSSKTWAPWENTRVVPGGLTYAPKGPGTKSITQDSWHNPLPLKTLGGVNWLDYPGTKSSLTKDNYIVEFDGAEGWLAHANKIGSTGALPLLFVKSFPDTKEANMPKNENEIQLWTSGTDPRMIEVEQQGEQKALAANEKLVWTTHWALCELPNADILVAGDEDLLKYTRAHAVKQ